MDESEGVQVLRPGVCNSVETFIILYRDPEDGWIEYASSTGEKAIKVALKELREASKLEWLVEKVSVQTEILDW